MTSGAGLEQTDPPVNATICKRCGHSSDDHAFSDSYVSDPDPATGIDFGPTHCHALGWSNDCEDTHCKCPDFDRVSS